MKANNELDDYLSIKGFTHLPNAMTELSFRQAIGRLPSDER